MYVVVFSEPASDTVVEFPVSTTVTVTLNASSGSTTSSPISPLTVPGSA
ncbi:MAG: hypothetical protein J07HX64_00009 [halophilic archaeon J07HX64]|nr:MAG: hypothetical protein J07HX64_00009 [halophilic archaeon J07HX64]